MRCFGLPLGEIAEPSDGPWATRLADIAGTHGLVIAAGMFTPADDGRVRNTLRVIGRGVDASYDKIHLFDAFGFASPTRWRPARTRWWWRSTVSGWASRSATTCGSPACSPAWPTGAPG